MSIDIVNLIESNPITKLNGNYQSKLIEKVKKCFTDYEQQIFLTSFYCYLKYDKYNDYVIDLDDIWKWVGFNQKVKAKVLLENNFILNKDYKKSLSQLGKQQEHVKGGHNKEIFMLNIKTFKLFCIKAGTKKAHEIHEYFIKLEDILHEVTDETNSELKLQFQQLVNKKTQEYEIKLEQQQFIEREKVLLKEYGSIGCIVYIIKVKSFENGRYIIKIGESRKGISERYKEHKSKYEECLLLDCFKVNKSKNFESFIHNKLKTHKVNNLPNHETELELFLIGKELTYQQVLKLINSNLENFNGNDINKLELENEQLKLMLEMKNSNNENPLLQEVIQSNNKLVNMVKQLSDKIDKLEEKISFSKSPAKLTTGFNEPLVTLGPRLQKIHPTTLELVKVYESVTELMKENSNIKRPSINKAVLENTVYCDYRWLLVDRELDSNIIHFIEPTRQTQVQNVGYIAQINLSKTEITNVFLDKKQACLLNGYTTSSALDTPVKNFGIAKGYYYKLYNECEDCLREKFENIYGSPLLYKNGVGKYDLDNNMVKEFACKYDCIKQLKISDKTLAKALENNTPYNGYYFKELGSKLKIV
jgi:phage anti-repressor protein